MERSLMILEQQHEITQRWSSSSPDYRAVRQISRQIKQSTLLQKITVKSQERFFMLDMKAKYASMLQFCRAKGVYVIMIVCYAHAGGHELSQKINKQITSITSNLRSLLQKYNSGEWENYPRTLTIQQVCSRDVSWMASATETNTPLALKNKVIDLWNLRASEEDGSTHVVSSKVSWIC